MSTFAAACLGLQLWTGTIGTHRAVCCFALGYEDLPPPNRPVYVSVSGPCRVRHFSHRGTFRGTFVGWDTNGPIHAELCRVVYDPGYWSYPATGKDCCAFAAEGPIEPGTGYAVLPPTLAGTYQCPTKRGMKTGTFALNLKETK